MLAESNNASLIRIIIRSFSALVMEHFPRSFLALGLTWERACSTS